MKSTKPPIQEPFKCKNLQWKRKRVALVFNRSKRHRKNQPSTKFANCIKTCSIFNKVLFLKFRIGAERGCKSASKYWPIRERCSKSQRPITTRLSQENSKLARGATPTHDQPSPIEREQFPIERSAANTCACATPNTPFNPL